MDQPGSAEAISVAIVGRPNVGKSTLFNRLIGDERAIVHDMPGTTRDAIDTVVETPEGPVRFIDTAGMRRRTKEAEGAEYYSMVRALRAIDQATLALLVIDATEGVTRQDQRLAERVDAAGNPVVIVLNKWDLLDTEAKAQVRAQVADMLGFVSYAPVLEVSAKTGRGVHRLYPALAKAVDAYRRRVPTASLNRAIAAAQAAQPAPHGARVLYATQGATDPPTFTLFTSKELPASYHALPRALDPGTFRLRADPAQVEGSAPGQLTVLNSTARYDQAGLVSDNDKLSAVASPELAHRPAHMGFGRQRAHVQLGCDLVVGEALGHQRQDLTLALGERLEQVGRQPGALAAAFSGDVLDQAPGD